MTDSNDFLQAVQQVQTTNGIVVRFPTELNREYLIEFGDSLMNPNWAYATTSRISGNGGIVEWLDDGSTTDPDPADSTNRNYRIEVQLP